MPVQTQASGHKALRKGRVSIANQIYLVTVCCNNREKLFLQPEAARALCSSLNCVLQKVNSKMLAWVVMPDHMHFLLQLAEDESLSKTMNRINSCMAIAVNKVLNRQSPVWEGAYHDHALRDDEQLHDAIRYVVANPIRAGLAGRLGDYPYWNISNAMPDEELLGYL